MSFYAQYIKRLIGGDVSVTKPRIQPGHIISFRYRTEVTRRRVNRLVLVLGKFNKGGTPLLHGVSLEFIPESKLYAFLKRVILKDTISQIKRKLELKGPFSELIDRPRSFYQNYVKKNLIRYDCYRTYKMSEIRRPKLYMLDWKKLKLFDNNTHPSAIINKTESLTEIKQSKMLLNKILKSDVDNLNNSRFKTLITDRFGSLDSFYEMLDDLRNFVDKPGADSENEFDASKS